MGISPASLLIMAADDLTTTGRSTIPSNTSCSIICDSIHGLRDPPKLRYENNLYVTRPCLSQNR
jgi:hypothetical protein